MSDTLQPGEELKQDQSLHSKNKHYRLDMQTDGNLVLYTADNKPVWASGTFGHTGSHTIMQADGNLVVYNPQNVPLFNTGTWGNPGAHLILQDDRNLVVYHPDGRALWATGTYLTAEPPPDKQYCFAYMSHVSGNVVFRKTLVADNLAEAIAKGRNEFYKITSGTGLGSFSVSPGPC